MRTPAVEENRSAQDLGIEFEHVNRSFISGNRAVLVLPDFSLNIEPAEFVSEVQRADHQRTPGSDDD